MYFSWSNPRAFRAHWTLWYIINHTKVTLLEVIRLPCDVYRYSMTPKRASEYEGKLEMIVLHQSSFKHIDDISLSWSQVAIVSAIIVPRTRSASQKIWRIKKHYSLGWYWKKRRKCLSFLVDPQQCGAFLSWYKYLLIRRFWLIIFIVLNSWIDFLQRNVRLNWNIVSGFDDKQFFCGLF